MGQLTWFSNYRDSAFFSLRIPGQSEVWLSFVEFDNQVDHEPDVAEIELLAVYQIVDRDEPRSIGHESLSTGHRDVSFERVRHVFEPGVSFSQWRLIERGGAVIICCRAGFAAVS